MRCISVTCAPLFVLHLGVCHAQVDLVREGTPVGVIVTPRDPPLEIQRAAQELKSYAARISGAELAVATELPEGSAVILEVDRQLNLPAKGKHDWPGGRGFRLRTAGNKLHVTGGDALGVLHGVYALLEHHLGVRWLWPGKLGEVVPQRPTITLGNIDETSSPDFPVRWVGTGDWALRHGANAMVKIGKQSVGVKWKWHFHTFCQLIPHETYFDEHPDWWPLVNGKRKKPDRKHSHGTQLCTTNPAMVAEMTKNLIAVLDKEPDTDIIALSPNDGGGFCECENCTKLDEPTRGWFARYSKRLAALNNAVAREVAKVHPDVLIKVGAYAMYLRRPLDEELAPTANQLIQMCHIYCCHSHPLQGDRCVADKTYKPSHNFMPNTEFREMIRDWSKVTDHLFIYEYYTLGGPTRVNYPWPLVHTMREDMPYYHEMGAEGFYTQLSMSVFHRYGLNYYVCAKLAWDTSLDVDALLTDYCDKAFGPAAQPMLAYVQLMEQALIDADTCLSYGLNNTHRFAPKVFTPEVLAQGDALFAKAMEAAPDGPQRQRVEFFKKGFDEAREAMVKKPDAPAKAKTAAALTGKKLRDLPSTWRFALDREDAGVEEEWFATACDDVHWAQIEVGRHWEDQGYPGYDGVAWYRKTIALTKDDLSAPLTLAFAGVDAETWVYVNGQLIGHHQGWDTPFAFDLPTEGVKPGRTIVIAVRVLDNSNKGGIYGGVSLYRPKAK